MILIFNFYYFFVSVFLYFVYDFILNKIATGGEMDIELNITNKIML